MPERDKSTWSQIDTAGKVLKSDVGEFFHPDDEAKAAPGKVIVRYAVIDGRNVFQTMDAQDHHVLGTFPLELTVGQVVDKSGLVVVSRFEKNQWGGGHFLHGYAKITGEIIVEPQYDEAGQFASNGLAPVRTSAGRWYIDTTGSFVIPPHFEDAKASATTALHLRRTATGATSIARAPSSSNRSLMMLGRSGKTVPRW